MWIPREPTMRRSARYRDFFEGINLPSIPERVNTILQKVNDTVCGAGQWISKLNIWANKTANATPPGSMELDDVAVFFVALCSCRTRKLQYVKITCLPNGPHFDKDIFEKLKEAYWRTRWRIVRTALKIWLFDVKEVRAVNVNPIQST